MERKLAWISLLVHMLYCLVLTLASLAHTLTLVSLATHCQTIRAALFPGFLWTRQLTVSLYPPVPTTGSLPLYLKPPDPLMITLRSQETPRSMFLSTTNCHSLCAVHYSFVILLLDHV
uniref:Uncharacterized protein n=1 Tax=Amphimedon queenslandica TaxID=400682 RepID=A0A1X7U1X8_AMPQE